MFAAGDVAGPPLLAHWAYHQGAIAAENAVTGANLHCDRTLVPSCTFSSPEVASCGITEDRAKAEGIAHEVAHVRFNGNSKAVCDGDAEGFVRIVCEPGGGKVLGASLIGPHVTELVHELALAAHSGLTLADVAAHHPRPSDAVRGGRRGRARRPRARRAQHLSPVPAPEDKPGRTPTAPDQKPGRKPAWLKHRSPAPAQYRATGALLDELELHTVCREARCPNKGECYASGTATFLILGDVCTRACRFCAVEGEGTTLRARPPARRRASPACARWTRTSRAASAKRRGAWACGTSSSPA